MKSEHRHELKTNELAEWLSNLPQWAKENRLFMICVSAVIIALVGFYIWRIHTKSVAAQKQIELTRLVSQLLDGKIQILPAYEQGRDLSFILLQPAENLGIFAENENDGQIAAFALIKRAEALRTELHYRMGAVPEAEAATQINEAKDSYTEALEKLAPPLPQGRGSNNPSLMSMAKFGLGLCEEELGNFETAEQIYLEITTNPDFDGTVASAQANVRLDTMANYKQKIIFKPAPKKPEVEITGSVDINLPAVEPSTEVNLTADANLIRYSPNAAPEVSNINDINQSGK